jgi:large subunit ribosomal protein L35
MPKMKTHKQAAKKFKITGTGKLKRMQAGKGHKLEKKSSKRKRNLRKSTLTYKAVQDNYKKTMPYL